MKTNTQKSKKYLRIALLVFAGAIFSIVTTGCNTIHGVGRDVEQTGEHIERAAR